MAARDQVPLRVPLKRLALTTPLLVVISCGGSKLHLDVLVESDFTDLSGSLGNTARLN